MPGKRGVHLWSNVQRGSLPNIPVALVGGHDGPDVAVQCMVADALWQAALHQPDHNQRHSDREQRGRQKQQPQGNDSDDEEPQREHAQQAWGWVPGECARFVHPTSTGAEVLSCPEGLLDGMPAVKGRPDIQVMQALPVNLHVLIATIVARPRPQHSRAAALRP